MPDFVRAQKEAGNDEVVPLDLAQYWLEQAKSSVIVIFVIHRPVVFTIDPENIKVSCHVYQDHRYLGQGHPCDIGHQFTVIQVTQREWGVVWGRWLAIVTMS